jgi:hypothetical protein
MRRIVVGLLGVLLGLAAISPVSAEESTTPTTRQVATVPATGAIFYPSVLGLVPVLGGPHFCSASVVHSPTKDLIVSAAHCIFGTGFTIEFAPLLHDNQLPGGVWDVTKIYIDPAKKLEDVVPGNPLGTPQVGAPITVSGYPMGSRGRPVTCTAPLSLVSGYPAIGCTGFGDGTSGGPWVQSGRVVGVIGGLDQGGCTPDVEYSTPFGASTQALYARAVAGGAADFVPIGFTANAC